MKEPFVFISYSSKDAADANALLLHLEGNGIPCWIAPRDIEAGKPYAANIMHAIDNCKAVVLVSSAAINESDHVLNEVDAIVAKKKPILPVFIEEFELSDNYRYYLGSKQWVVAYPGTIDSYYGKIIDAVSVYLPSYGIFIEERRL